MVRMLESRSFPSSQASTANVDTLRYVIGIYNKKTGKVDLVETKGVFSMDQRIKNLKVKQKPEISEVHFDLNFANIFR